MAMKFLKVVLNDDSASDSGYYFRDKTSTDEAKLVVVSVPWSVTSDYGRGAAYAPDAIIDASDKKDIYDLKRDISHYGSVATADIDYNIQECSGRLGHEAERIALSLEESDTIGERTHARIERVNVGFGEMQASVYRQVRRIAKSGKQVAIVGGDQSVAFGAVKALSEHHKGIGVLNIDAHADLKHEGVPYTYSHTTVMRNIAEELSCVGKIVEVGVRDINHDELAFATANDKVEIHFSEELAARRFEGETWGKICDEICESLPPKVYISFDIDALKIEFCHNTNSPVPGGMTFDEVVYLVNRVVATGHTIVGFDITEVVPNLDNVMDANVAARLLGKMIVAALNSVYEKSE